MHGLGHHGRHFGGLRAAGPFGRHSGEGPRFGRGGRGGGDWFRVGRMLAQGDLKLLALALIAELGELSKSESLGVQDLIVKLVTAPGFVNRNKEELP